MNRERVLSILRFLGVLTDGAIDTEAVKALCKAYEEAHGVVPATALEAIAWAVKFANPDHQDEG